MRYIGGKSLLVDRITGIIASETKNVQSVVDIFSGSGVVAKALKEKGYKAIANDALYFSYVLNRGTLSLNTELKFSKLKIKNPIDYLNKLELKNTNIEIDKCFIYQNYTPNENCTRMYFQNENALKIDLIRITIEKWYLEEKITENEYFYLLASLIAAVPYISNITGVYASYLKHWDHRSYKALLLLKPCIIESKKECISYNADVIEIASSVKADAAYLDPPYNNRQYLPNYHILETIAKYDYPIIKGKTGMRDYGENRSDFCRKATAINAFKQLFSELKTKYILVSYNNEGIVSTDEMTNMLKECGKPETFKLFECNYRRYKNKIPNNSDGLKEQIYFIEKGM